MVAQTTLVSVTEVVELVVIVAEKNLPELKFELKLPDWNPDPASPLVAEAQVTLVPLDQFEIVTPDGGVVQVAVGTAGQVIVAPPPTVTTV